MSAEADLRTERLALWRPDPAADLAEVYGVFSDPVSWTHAPEKRHTEPEQTRDWLARTAVRWDTDGLSYWVARLRDSGDFVGVGGVERHVSGAWNVFYRLSPGLWGRGLATELSRVGLARGAQLDPQAPAVAWILPHNQASRRVADRLGLINHGLRVDASDGTPRLAYADRPLADRYGAPVASGAGD